MQIKMSDLGKQAALDAARESNLSVGIMLALFDLMDSMNKVHGDTAMCAIIAYALDLQMQMMTSSQENEIQ